MQAGPLVACVLPLGGCAGFVRKPPFWRSPYAFLIPKPSGAQSRIVVLAD